MGCASAVASPVRYFRSGAGGSPGGSGNASTGRCVPRQRIGKPRRRGNPGTGTKVIVVKSGQEGGRDRKQRVDSWTAELVFESEQKETALSARWRQDSRSPSPSRHPVTESSVALPPKCRSARNVTASTPFRYRPVDTSAVGVCARSAGCRQEPSAIRNGRSHFRLRG
jgi:hypothetical protein